MASREGERLDYSEAVGMRGNGVNAEETSEGPCLDISPGSQVAGFVVEGRIASGGGVVLKATRGNQAFALKLVPRGPRAEREVDALRRAQCPHVVGFRGYGLWPDDEPRFVVLAMELVEGRPL